MPHSPFLLPALGAAVLLVTGLALLVPGTPASRPSPAAAAPPALPSLSPEAVAPGVPATAPAAAPSPPVPVPAVVPSAPAAASPAPSAAPSPEVMPSGIPAAGDGPAGDPALQAAFSRQHPSDLTAADAEQLGTLAGQVWLAETTGAGRERWPAYFTAPGSGAGRLYLYSDVRVQAVAARTAAGAADRARVDLLWVGTSPTGNYGDQRPATLTFVRTATGWEPVR
ncbi:hypothetical protein ACFVH7_22400 [Kitasatospora indigofera]|uniref:hypothetical protein n=1 Tax=Kitasatospora indigofera TaxID=67307 RepID=UPI00363FA360